jgi:hypothetical protein
MMGPVRQRFRKTHIFPLRQRKSRGGAKDNLSTMFRDSCNQGAIMLVIATLAPLMRGAALGVAAAVVLMAALDHGRSRERLGAGALGTAWAAAAAAWSAAPELHRALIWTLTAADLGCLLLFAGLAWKSERLWPALAAGLETVIVAAHVIALSQPQTQPAAHHLTVTTLL